MLAVTFGFISHLPAQAAAREATCKLSGSVAFSPGITTKSVPETFTTRGTLSGCLSSDPMLKSGTFSGSGSGTTSCITGTLTARFTISWNTGKRTALSLTLRVLTADGLVTGTVARSTEPALKPGDGIAGDVVAGLGGVGGNGQNCITTPITSDTLTGQLAAGAAN